MKNLSLLLLLTLILFFTVSNTLYAGNIKIISLKDAVQKALNAHPSIKAEKMAFEAQKETTNVSRSAFFPSVDFSSSVGYERAHNSLTRSRFSSGMESRDYRNQQYNTETLSLTQLLYDGHYTKSRLEANEHRLATNKILADSTSDQVALQTIESYMDVLRARKMVLFAKQNIEQIKALEEKTQIRFKSGKGTATDVGRIQLTLFDTQALLINYQGMLQYAEDSFMANTGLPLPCCPNRIFLLIPLQKKWKISLISPWKTISHS